ncbi:hypothetical protein [Clostridium sp. 1001271B_151109_B4]|uniref:hypothetical protein n=1 Tax=Clostridium sp. 1001271B_151109_B4 TaxID=2787148 RepID=UPI0018A97D94|nr:hypothetical protein [Clostridium sp. 1001271B_151109_B4]
MTYEKFLKVNLLDTKILKEKELNDECRKLLLEKNVLIDKINMCEKMFKKTVVSSTKINELYSYNKYSSLCNDKVDYEIRSNEIRNKIGLFKSLINTDR